MGLRLIHANRQTNVPELEDPVGCTTEFDGQSYHWGPGERKVVPDAGVGDGHAGNVIDSDTTVVEDNSGSGLIHPVTEEART